MASCGTWIESCAPSPSNDCTPWNMLAMTTAPCICLKVASLVTKRFPCMQDGIFES